MKVAGEPAAKCAYRTYLYFFPLKPRPHGGEVRALLLGDPPLLSHSCIQSFRASHFGLQLAELCPPETHCVWVYSKKHASKNRSYSNYDQSTRENGRSGWRTRSCPKYRIMIPHVFKNRRQNNGEKRPPHTHIHTFLRGPRAAGAGTDVPPDCPHRQCCRRH